MCSVIWRLLSLVENGERVAAEYCGVLLLVICYTNCDVKQTNTYMNVEFNHESDYSRIRHSHD